MVTTKLIAVMAIGAALGLVQSAPTKAPSKVIVTNQDVCNTPQCRVTAAGFLHDMNPNVDPCEDFQQFTCGGFFDKMKIDPTFREVSTLSSIQIRNNAIIREIADPSLGKAPKATSGDYAAASNLKKLHDLWASCMNVSELDKRGRRPLVNEINSVIDTIPNVTSRVDSTGLAKTLAKMVKIQVDSFIKLDITPDLYNPSVNVIEISSSGLSLPIESFNATATVAQLEHTIAIGFQKFLGPELRIGAPPLTINRVDPKWVAAAKKVVAFQVDISRAINSAPVSRAVGQAAFYNPWTIERLNAVTPSVNWDVLIADLMPAGETYARPLIALTPDYFTGLEAVLTRTPSDVFHYYTIYRLIETHHGRLGAAYRPGPPIEHREDLCVAIVNDNLGEIAGHYFVNQTLPELSKVYFKSLIHQILASYGKSIPKLDWLDTTTVSGALKKLNSIVELVAESSDSPNTSSSTSLEEYYRSLVIDPTDYFGNRARKAIWWVAFNFSQVNKPVNRQTLPESPPQTLNAFYGPQTNEIYFPAGMLQAPLFHADNPDYMNYGAMGVIAGHEIGWWTPSTSTKFIQKSQCIAKQFSTYTVPGPNGTTLHVNGNITLGENIADNGGIKYSFAAWQDVFNSDPQGITHKNFKLPGLEKYTPEQMFFISYARTWCEKSIPEKVADQLQNDSHSPPKWRIVGGVQNSPDFAKAFKCRAGTRMNPINKCSLW
ncbi:hypothetical protein BGZ95_007863 [Linnemannia exigua]|uniref:Zincin n=1 Tax=Linnemannia exigua TaxID=604196 RepID=A0AAD4DES7_9FUNG|nr:hypothetical protein BGZ95_007863 [Linnemannia exigua]